MLYDKKWDKEVKIVDEIGQKLLEAADYIERNGWCQHAAFHEGRACMLGGIYAACGGEDRGEGFDTCPFNYDKAVSRIAKFAPGLGVWNDHPHRTKDEVVAVLRKAAYAE